MIVTYTSNDFDNICLLHSKSQIFICSFNSLNQLISSKCSAFARYKMEFSV